MLPKILIIIVIVVVGFLGLGFMSMKLGIKPPGGIPSPQIPQFPNFQGQFSGEDYFADTANLPSCGDKKDLFSISPLKLTDFHGIVPLGTLAPTAHVVPTSHIYFHVRRSNPKDFDSLPVEVPAFAPADITITELRFTQTKERADFDDGVIIFSPCKEVKAYLDHFKTFSSDLKKAYDEGEVIRCDQYQRSYNKFGTLSFKHCNKKVNIEVKAGEQIGTAGGGQGQMVFDFGVVDKSVTPAVLANPKAWVGRDQIKYSVCPLDYYSGDLKEQLKSRLGTPDGSHKRGAEPFCGTVIQDIPGTASGVWLAKGEAGVGHENPHLALAHDNIDPKLAVFSMGNSAENRGFSWGTYNFNPQNSGLINRDFKDIKDNQVYCFETEDTYHNNTKTVIILQMPTPTSLKIEKLNSSSCGSGPWQIKDYTEFER